MSNDKATVEERAELTELSARLGITPPVPPLRRELREFKFIVQPVLLVIEGEKLGELATDPVALYGIDGLREFIAQFPIDLAGLNA